MTPDDIAFLKRAGAFDRVKTESADDHAREVGPPRFPRKTVIAVLIAAILVFIGVASALQQLEPYASLAKDKDLTSYLEMSSQSQSGADGSDIGSQAESASQVFSMRWAISSGVVIASVIIEAIVITQWAVRRRLWEDKRHEDKR
jgi:hypothetical protein